MWQVTSLPERLRGSRLGSALRGTRAGWRDHHAPPRLPIDYPPSLDSRWGYRIEPPAWLADLFAPAASATMELLRQHLSSEVFGAVPVQAGEHVGAYWNNRYLSPVDAATLMAIVAAHRPARVVEVGSGHSTRFFDAARRFQGATTHLTSIDPAPRAEVRGIADTVVEQRVEALGAEPFAALRSGDVLFIDGSHRVLTDSDTVALFLEVLPSLPPGVLVHVHDVFLPRDYPSAWRSRFYSEQYLVAALLWGVRDRVEILAANAHLADVARSELDAWWTSVDGPPRPSDVFDCSLWFRVHTPAPPSPLAPTS